ncbi:unnamed protein product [Sphagnum tenellum]
MKINRISFNTLLTLDYTGAGPSADLSDKFDGTSEVILLLHGYEQKASSILGKLQSVRPSHTKFIAPNGIFPVPRRVGSSFKVGYSWYFFDPHSNEYLIDMSVSVQAIVSLIEKLEFQSIPKRIIGFSQGGYLAPFVAHRLKNVRQVIGVGCDYLIDELPPGIEYRWDGIHGKRDEIVDWKKSQLSHSRLSELGIEGKFYTLEEVGHDLSPPVVETLAQVLRGENAA